MQRMLVRVAALALCTSALSACSVMGRGETSAMVAPGSDNVAPLATPSDLTGAIQQAQALRLKGDLDGATHVISQLMLAAPDDARVVGEYGKLLVQENRSDDAAQFLRRAVELDASNWTYYSALGVAYDQLKDPASAKNAYDHALMLKPGEPAILNNYAMSRMLAGDPKSARTLLMQAKASGSADPKLDQNLALLDSMTPAVGPAPAVASVAPAPVHAAVAVAPPVAHATAAVAAHAATPVASATPTPATAHPASAVANNALPPAPLHTTAPAAITPAEVRAVPTVTANGAPTPITHNGVSIVMQTVPVDPKAGKVASTAHKWVKPVTVAKTAAPLHVTAAASPAPAATPAKVAKSAKPANQIPALRMTADLTKP